MISAITFITGLILVTGVCNDTATLTQIVIFAMLGFTLMILSVFLNRRQQYKLDFVAPNGKHKTILAYSFIGKLMAIRRYTKNGYILNTEYEIYK